MDDTSRRNGGGLAAVAGVSEVQIPGVRPWRRGKVRSIFEAGPDHLVVVASDRLSAYDVVLPTPIPDKGRVLSRLSAHWMRALASARPHHLVSDDPDGFPAPFNAHRELLRDRAQLVRRAQRIDVECVVRGYLTGSGLKEYKKSASVCGLQLPAGLSDGSRLDPPLFTPTTKAEEGHDMPMTFDEVVAQVGRETAEALRRRSVAIYQEARDVAWERGLVLADTKFEFGLVEGAITLIDEILSPDSSRYWDRSAYERGELFSFDKQYVRDWLDASGWDHSPPGPTLPDDVVGRTRDRYLEALERITGKRL
jgi:phosphoribosylaminoimidazole-succinocarboxamide synthase